MKVLMISNDLSIVIEGSKANKRMVSYGKLVRELHIILFSKRGSGVRGGRISNNTFVYPTHSRFRVFQISGAVRIGKRIPRCDLVTVQDPYETGLAGRKLAAYHKAKFQVQVHTDIWSSYFAHSFLDSVRQILAERTLRSATCIRAVSRRVRNSLISKGFVQQISILPIYTDIEALSLKAEALAHRKRSNPYPFTILMVGRLSREKNISFALRVLQALRQRGVEAGLVVAGEGKECKKLLQYSEKLGIRKQVKFVGQVDDLLSYYQNADVFLHTAFYEGYGLAVVEAAASGVPIVGTDVGILGDVLKDGTHALVRSQGDVDGFAEALVLLSNDQELRKRLVHNAKTIVKEQFQLTYREYLEKIVDGWKHCGA